MATVEISCPNCGAAQGTPAPHQTRICRFCGTHYLLRPQEHASQPEATSDHAESERQWGNLRAVIAIIVLAMMTLVAILVYVLGKSDETPSNDGPPSYYAPRR